MPNMAARPSPPDAPWSRVDRWLRVVALAAPAWALVVAVTGGFVVEWGPVYFSSRKPKRALQVAAVALLLILVRSVVRRRASIGAFLARGARRLGVALARAARASRRLAARVRRAISHAAPWLAVALALFTGVEAYEHGAHAVGGSDSWGYAAEASLMVEGRLHLDEPLAAEVPWPFAEMSFAPLGFRPAAERGVYVPVYPPGLPAVMALFLWAGGREAIFLIVPLFAALAVATTYLFAAGFAGRAVGLASAAWLAASPAFIFQSRLPMSDVPVTAWWLLAILGTASASRAAPWLAGLAAGMAVVTRPNLAPLALPLVVYVAAGSRRREAGRPRLARPLAFLAGPAAALCALLWMNQVLYGSSLTTGYGPAENLFAWGNILPNAARYGQWLIATETPLVLLCVLAPWLALGGGAPGALPRRAEIRLWLAMAAIVWASYLPYVQFFDWSYLRFVLPVLPLMLCLAIAAAIGLGARIHPAWGRAAVLVAFVPFLVWQTGIARGRTRDSTRTGEHKYRAVGEYVARAYPPGVVAVSMQHSGSLRYYGGSTALRWDWIERQWLDEEVAWLEERGHPVCFVLEDSEEAPFRDRFALGNALGRLDWPPAAELDIPGATIVRVYDPRDRARFLAGDAVETVPIPAVLPESPDAGRR